MLSLPAIAASFAIVAQAASASPIAQRQQPAPTVVTLPLPVETAANFASVYLPYSGDAIQPGDEYTTVIGFASLVATETISGQAVTETMVLARKWRSLRAFAGQLTTQNRQRSTHTSQMRSLKSRLSLWSEAEMEVSVSRRCQLAACTLGDIAAADINYCDIEGNVAICEVGHVYPGPDTTEISLGPTYSYAIAPSAVTLHPVKVASIVDTPEDLLSIYTQVGNQPLPTRL